MKKNCWEYKKCGREPGGSKVSELGICPAATETKTYGINSGHNGGRCCWVIAETFCDGEVNGSFENKYYNCLKCDFHQLVYKEELSDENWTSTRDVIKVLLKRDG